MSDWDSSSARVWLLYEPVWIQYSGPRAVAAGFAAAGAVAAGFAAEGAAGFTAAGAAGFAASGAEPSDPAPDAAGRDSEAAAGSSVPPSPITKRSTSVSPCADEASRPNS